jgi:hypothetical protein
MTKPLEFGTAVRQEVKARGHWCHACGVAGVGLEMDHVIPRELFPAKVGLIRIVAGLNDADYADDAAVRAYMVSADNAQLLCQDCHNAKSRVEGWQIKADKYLLPIRATAHFTKPTHVIPDYVTDWRTKFKESMKA